MTKKITLAAFLCVIAVAVSGLEHLIPLDFMIPGIKLGLSNIVILLVLYRLGIRCGMAVTCCKSLLAALLFGGFSSFLYSISGAFCSALVMGVIYRRKDVTPLGVSMLGAAVHVTAQVVCALLMMKSIYVLGYYPFVLLSGLLCGLLNGIIVAYILKKYQRGESV